MLKAIAYTPGHWASRPPDSLLGPERAPRTLVRQTPSEPQTIRLAQCVTCVGHCFAAGRQERFSSLAGPRCHAAPLRLTWHTLPHRTNCCAAGQDRCPNRALAPVYMIALYFVAWQWASRSVRWPPWSKEPESALLRLTFAQTQLLCLPQALPVDRPSKTLCH